MLMTMLIDTTGMNAALERYIPTTRRDLAEIVNQRTLNVAGRAFDHIAPHGDGNDVQAKRQQIKLYLREPLSTRIKLAHSGKRKGQIIRKGARNKQLQRVHLIINAWRRFAGKKGLYGAEMMKASGAFKARAQISAGFLKSVWLPILKRLNPIVRYKFPFAKTSRISIWPGSAGYGRISIAKNDVPAPEAIFQIAIALAGRAGKPSQESKVQAMEATALQAALNEEAAELNRHVLEKLSKSVKEQRLAA